MERTLPFFRKFRTDKSIYGLLGMPENCFYVIDSSHHVIKLLQFIMMKQKFFFCVNISKFESDTDTYNINNSNCYNYGCIPKSAKYIMLDSDPGMHLATVIKTASAPNEQFRNNLILLQKILHTLEQTVDEFEDQEQRRFQDQINGLNEFKDFVKITNPGDSNIDDFVELEISARTDAIKRSQPYRRGIINSLIDFDYQQTDTKEKILEKINSMDFARSDYIGTGKGKMFLSDIFKKTLISSIRLHR